MFRASRYMLAVATILCVTRADAQTTVPALEADVETTYRLPNGQQFSHVSHLYRSQSGATRQDSGRGAMITDLQRGRVTLLIAETKQAHVITVPPAQRAGVARERPQAGIFERTTIDGHPVVKARTKRADGQTQEVWTATDLGLVTFSSVASPAGVTTTQTVRSVTLHEPDATVFEIPQDYTVIQQSFQPGIGRGRGRGSDGFPHPLGGRGITMLPPPAR